MIGFLSQLGYVVAYAVAGSAADAPGQVTGLGVGRGASLVVIISGVCLAITAATIFFSADIRELEKN